MNNITVFFRACLIVMTVFGLILAGCATAPAPESAAPVEEPAEPSQEQPEQPEEAPEPFPEEEIPEEPSEEFEVTEEIYEQTFSDVENLIQDLNKIISSGNYSKWLTYLTEPYKERYSDPAVLAELSRQPTLKKYDIRLRTLEDYFRYVVVPSRSEVRLDEIIFNDEEHVKALMEIDDRQVILYRLRLVDGSWKIGLAK
ncbi:MAG: hypothetical protein ACLFRY_04220 [Spirochaetia bacterium]